MSVLLCVLLACFAASVFTYKLSLLTFAETDPRGVQQEVTGVSVSVSVCGDQAPPVFIGPLLTLPVSLRGL